MPPKVSVNICCYNSEKYIRNTIQSVLNQTFKDFEIIIIDDGSKDKTGELIKAFTDPRIKYYYQENRGLSASRNRAIELSQGEYIALLDHDDLWEPEKIDLQVAIMESNPQVGLVYSDAYFIDEKDNKMGRYLERKGIFYRGRVTGALIRDDFIPCLTVVMRKELIKKAGWFRAEFHIAEEYDLFLRLSLITEFDFVNRPLAGYRIHSGNVSKNYKKMHEEEKVIFKRLAVGLKDILIGKAIKKRLYKINLLLLILSLPLIGNYIYETLKPLKSMLKNISAAIDRF